MPPVKLFRLFEHLEHEITGYLELKGLAVMVETCKAASAIGYRRLTCIRCFHVIVMQADMKFHLQSFLYDQELALLTQCSINLRNLTANILAYRKNHPKSEDEESVDEEAIWDLGSNIPLGWDEYR
jgi:hypothetical protein